MSLAIRNLNKSSIRLRPRVWVVGDVNHSDFRDVVSLLEIDMELRSFSNARLAASGNGAIGLPELIVIAQARPGDVDLSEVETLRRHFPLAGIVSLLGSWCEGHSRTGRPVPGAERVYWHEFRAWWLRQSALLSAGRCPDWARPESANQSGRFHSSVVGPNASAHQARCAPNLVVIESPRWETADVLGDILADAGYSTVWQPAGRATVRCRGPAVGVWEGGQLDGGEAERLEAFCRQLTCDAAPVVALLDFPRRDTLEQARRHGAVRVMGKPWSNSELIATVRELIETNRPGDVATNEPSAA